MSRRTWGDRAVLIRTEDEPPPERLTLLRQVAADTIAPFDPRFGTGPDVRAQVISGPAGALQVTRVQAPPMRALRTPRLIRAADPEMFKIDVQLHGHTVFSQSGREAALAPGDFTLVDLSRPSALGDLAEEHDVLALSFPHAALPLRHDELGRLTAVAISGRDGLGAPISALAQHIAQRLRDFGPTEGARLGAALMDLLIVALAERLDRVDHVAAATQRRVLLTTVQAFIDRRLDDPQLSPSTIARANNISLRYLHKLFETEPTTVAGWIRQRRLDRCRRDLLDPALRHWPVSTIAVRWGVADAAHFSRVFRAEYGLPPAEFRLAAGSSG